MLTVVFDFQSANQSFPVHATKQQVVWLQHRRYVQLSFVLFCVLLLFAKASASTIITTVVEVAKTVPTLFSTISSYRDELIESGAIKPNGYCSFFPDL